MAPSAGEKGGADGVGGGEEGEDVEEKGIGETAEVVFPVRRREAIKAAVDPDAAAFEEPDEVVHGGITVWLLGSLFIAK